MSNVFTNASKRIENSPWVFLLFLLFCWGSVLSFGLFVEDFQANLGVASMIPTRKAVDTSIWVMAAFLQVAPIALGYTFLRDTNKRIAGLGSLGFLAIDWFLGWFFRSNGLSAGWQLYAAAEDFVFFTVGSELFLVLFVGMAASLTKPAFDQLAVMVVALIDSPKKPEQQFKPGVHPPHFQHPRGPNDTQPMPFMDPNLQPIDRNQMAEQLLQYQRQQNHNFNQQNPNFRQNNHKKHGGNGR